MQEPFLVIFMFVIVLFQDAHQQIDSNLKRKAAPIFIVAALLFLLALIFLERQLIGLMP